MTTELYWLILTTAMTAVMWLPYIVNRAMELGPPPTAWHPQPDPPPKAAWAARTVRAHMNAVENLAIFAPLILIIHATHSETATTATVSMVYFFARAAHYAICLLGIPIPYRTAAFLLGFICQMILVATLLSVRY